MYVCVCVSDTFLTMGWLRLVGFLKLWVSFAKEPYKRDNILQKRPIILRSLLIVATPYLHLYVHECLRMHVRVYVYVCVCVCVCMCMINYTSLVQNSLFYRALLQKRPIILRSLLIMCVSDRSLTIHIYMNVCVCVCVCYVCACVCVCVCTYVCMRGWWGLRISHHVCLCAHCNTLQHVCVCAHTLRSTHISACISVNICVLCICVRVYERVCVSVWVSEQVSE